ncbi:HTH-type transcriptional regulator AdhR [compost metagenome]
MDPILRSDNGHRCYDEGDLEWIILLKHLRDTGMSIADMQLFANLMREGDAGIQGRRELLEEHERKINIQVAQLQETLHVLKNKITYYRSWETQVATKEQP